MNPGSSWAGVPESEKHLDAQSFFTYLKIALAFFPHSLLLSFIQFITSSISLESSGMPRPERHCPMSAALIVSQPVTPPFHSPPLQNDFSRTNMAHVAYLLKIFQCLLPSPEKMKFELLTLLLSCLLVLLLCPLASSLCVAPVSFTQALGNPRG